VLSFSESERLFERVHKAINQLEIVATVVRLHHRVHPDLAEDLRLLARVALRIADEIQTEVAA